MEENNQEIVAVYALTAAGLDTARRICAGIPGAQLFLTDRLARAEGVTTNFGRLAEAMAENFEKFSGHVVVSPAGTVVRAVAPLLTEGYKDPAVVTVDPEGRYAISLVAGHLGGANELTNQVAGIIEAHPVITTAAPSTGKPVLEELAREVGLTLENLRALNRISVALQEDENVPVYDPDGWFRPTLCGWPDLFRHIDYRPRLTQSGQALRWPLIWVGPETLPLPDSWLPENWLMVRPPCLSVGFVCEKDSSEDELAAALKTVFEDNNLSPASVKCLAAVDGGGDINGLSALAGRMNVELQVFSYEDLKTAEGELPLRRLCEAAALKASSSNCLTVSGHAHGRSVLAVARFDCPGSSL